MLPCPVPPDWPYVGTLPLSRPHRIAPHRTVAAASQGLLAGAAAGPSGGPWYPESLFHKSLSQTSPRPAVSAACCRGTLDRYSVGSGAAIARRVKSV